MTYKKIIAALLLIGSVVAITAFKTSDDDPINKIATLLDNWLSDNPQEKVYLQLDKPYYAIGDDIWFKAYVTIGGKHALSALSGALNVELIDENDSVKRAVKLPLVNGLAWGDFALTDSLPEGNYRIRAYTNYMRNAGEAYFFDKTFTVTNSISNNVFTNTAFTYNSQNGQQHVNSVISYADLDGQPYAAAQVSYKVIFGSKTIAHGKGQTDDKGNLTVSFINSNPALLKSGRITTELKLANKKVAYKSVLIKAASASVDVQFFPEGGNLVNLLQNKVAFKAVAADGLGTDVKGVIIDNQNNQVSTFSSSHLGMGTFNLLPESGKTYKARLTYADGSEATVDLPAATNNGYVLSIDDSDENNLSVKIRPGAVVTGSTSLTDVISLVGQSGGIIYYAAKSSPGSKFFTAIIPKSKFPSGIVQFTMFSATGEPLNERLVFLMNNDQLKLNVSAEKTYTPRQKVKIDLTATDPDSKPVIGSFSASVTDETKTPVDEQTENTILSNLLLTSDLRGYIEKPGYYFDAPDAKKQADLDVLMLIQGYHRFEWRQLMTGYPPIRYQPEKSLEVTGHIKTMGGKPVVNGHVILFASAGSPFLMDTVSDSQGRFAFKNLIFRDSLKFVVQARTEKDRKNLQIELDTIAPEGVGKNKNAADLQINISGALSPFLRNSRQFYNEQMKYGIINHSIMLKEVQITEKKFKNPVENSANLNGPGNADQVLKNDELGLFSCAHITDCLQGRLLGVIFRNGIPYSTRSPRQPMAVVIDGAFVDNTFLDALNPIDIASVEVLRSITYTAIYGGQGAGGILVFTTKVGNGSYGYQHYAPGIITYAPKGYYKARTFYSPQYDNPKTNTQVADLRTTIYWKPDIFTDKDGKASFEYFNADTKGTYRVVIEGMDAEGKLGRIVYHYKVE